MILQINENGILSFGRIFTTTFIREFGSIRAFQSLIAPLWTDLDINRFGGSIFLRTTSNPATLERARNLTVGQFCNFDFEPTSVVIMTWFEVGHRFLGGSNEVYVHILMQWAIKSEREYIFHFLLILSSGCQYVSSCIGV